MADPVTNAPPIPADDPRRTLAVAGPDNDAQLRHVSLAGDTYTILLGGADTGGRYTLIDMLIPPGGGPPPHRHDFEESFTLLEGEVEFTFRGQKRTAGAGTTVNIPANAPHSFRNVSATSVRLLCLCAPAGQEEFFLAVGDLVPSRTSSPPKLTAAEIAARQAKAMSLASV